MKKTYLLVVLLGITILAILPSEASAFYHPRMGRFVQRDPGPGGPSRVGTAGPAANGSFAQRDPIGQYTDGMNLYQYVKSNPIRFVDPDGLWGRDMHYTETFKRAQDVGYNNKCARILASWNQGVDDWSGASLFPWYHFNKDINGKRFSCGRDCWFEKRWNKGLKKLKEANINKSFWGAKVEDGLASIGESLHSRQDKFTHNFAHNAATPFDHAPSVFCFLWGDGLGIIHQRCIDARLHNPNWSDPHRPDKRELWPVDWDATAKDTEFLLEIVWKIPAVQCYCKKK